MSEPRVKYGQGDQTIRFTPVDPMGRPARVTSATYTIVDIREPEDGDDRVIATGSAVLPAVDTTLTVAGGAGSSNARSFTLASAALVAEGRAYLLSSNGTRSLVLATGVAGSVVSVKSTPGAAFPIGATFQSIELEATFPAVEANDSRAIEEQRRYQITWSYELQGERYLTAQIVWLVRYSGEAWITEIDAIAAYPMLPDRIRGKATVPDCIVAATRDFISELEGAGVQAEYYRTSTPGQLAMANRAVEYGLRWAGSESDQNLAELYMTRYEKGIANLIAGGQNKAVKLSSVDDTERDARVDGLFRRS